MSKKHDSYESIRDERRYGPYWYSALWRIIRPILIGICERCCHVISEHDFRLEP